LTALLRGERAEWNGEILELMHPPGFGAERPVDVPILFAANGPVGLRHAREAGAAGVMLVSPHPVPDGWSWTVALQLGTVLGDGESLDAPRVLDAAGHAAAVVYHGSYEQGGRDAVSALPHGSEWFESVAAAEPEASRHLAVHAGHLVGVNEHDRVAVTGDVIAMLGMARSAAQWRAHLDTAATAGLTEIAYQPAGSDIPGELERFAAAAGL
jgi:5,10-methylenetetrahydromethanopterin reductase